MKKRWVIVAGFAVVAGLMGLFYLSRTSGSPGRLNEPGMSVKDEVSGTVSGSSVGNAYPVAVSPSVESTVIEEPQPLRPAVAGALADGVYRRKAVQQREAVARQRLARAAGIVPSVSPDRGLVGIVDGQLIEYKTFNRNAAISSGVDLLHPPTAHGLDGDGVTVGVWDAGSVRELHQEFGGRISNEDGVATHFHSTHVGGTIAATGVQANAKGMAPASRIDSYDWNSDLAEMTQRAMATPDDSSGLPISNHSYGSVTGWDNNGDTWRWYGTWGDPEAIGFGNYNRLASDWDTLCYEAPYYLPFKAAGNDRNDGVPSSGASFQYLDGAGWVTKSYNPATDPGPDQQDQGGYDTLPNIGNAKNIMTVGAVNDAVLDGERYVPGATMTAFSCWGPTDDGRIKPDLVANGAGLYSTSSESDTSYQTLSGTSMASPAAAGSAALIAGLHRRRTGESLLSSTLKALLIHTADDLGRAGPDYQFGWGLLNAKAAVDFLTRHHDFAYAGWLSEPQLSTNAPVHTQTVQWDGTDPIRATLCWTDPPAQSSTNLDDRASVLIHDLDLRIIGPSGTNHFAYALDVGDPLAVATTGTNRLDNVEQIYIPSPVAGFYTIEVRADHGLTNGMQAASLLLGGFTAEPQILHEPLPHQADTLSAYPIEAEIISPDPPVSNLVLLVWESSAVPGVLHTNLLVSQTNDLYLSEIPAQPLGTTVHYFLSAANEAGLSVADPPDAPTTRYSFEVRQTVQLMIFGTPDSFGTVVPPYGMNQLASGVVVQASAEPFTPAVNGRRKACSGWVGNADVPVSGTSNAVDIALGRDSALFWIWDDQSALVQSGPQGSGIDATNWWAVAEDASTLEAPAFFLQGNDELRFTGWTLDGVRMPDADSQAVNPVTGINMQQPHGAEAHYLPAEQDSDGDGLADWWEQFYYGSLDISWEDDSDEDGYLELEEFMDNSNPRDSNSTPGGPVIEHVPLATPQLTPAPWRVEARITDNSGISSATLRWRRNGIQTWRTASMQPLQGDPDLYAAEIAVPGILGDTVTYEISASDLSGYLAEEGPYAFEVVYPLARVSPPSTDLLLLKGQSTNIILNLNNDGNTSLVWNATFSRGGFADDMEQGDALWQHEGPGDLWHISTRRSHSGSFSWYCGNEGSGQYDNSMDARLVISNLDLAAGASLTFDHWMNSEVNDAETTWDGGNIEISTAGSTHWSLLIPEGGYPYSIVNNPASPFEDDTPVYGGTGGWQNATFDLSEYAHQNVRIRFRFGSDELVVDEGWFIDDVAVGPLAGSNGWVTLNPDFGTLPSYSETQVVAGIQTDSLPGGWDETQFVDFSSNDPIDPVVRAAVNLRVRSIPRLSILSAQQTSTNGEGLVTLSAELFDPDQEICELAVQYQTNSAALWIAAPLGAASAEWGSPAVSTGGLTQVTNILTSSGDETVTNTIHAVWDTQRADQAVLITTNARLAVRAWDGLFWSEAVTSTPFLVDNEAPHPPTELNSPTHSPGSWSTQSLVQLSWPAADDGAGIGAAVYLPQLRAGGTVLTGAPVATLSGVLTAPWDATNWVAGVVAVDAYGNRSALRETDDPFWIDTIAPTGSQVVISFGGSSGGDYIVGSSAHVGWTPFTDNLSGVAGFLYALNTSNTTYTTNHAVLSPLFIPNATNQFVVWPQDHAGLIGAPHAASILALDEEGDFDGDGISNAGEKLTGTDAVDPESLFSILSINRVEPAGMAVAWPAATGAVYSLCRADQLSGSNTLWLPVSGLTNLPGFAGIMNVTNVAESASNRFFRVFVEPENSE